MAEPTKRNPDQDVTELRTLVQQSLDIQRQQAETISALTQALKASGGAATVESILVKRELELEKQRKEIADFAEYHNLPHDRRGQIAVNERYKDGPRFFRCHLSAPAFPVLVIRGHSQHEAEARYREACGIQWIKPAELRPDGKPGKWTHQIQVVDVTDSPNVDLMLGYDRAEPKLTTRPLKLVTTETREMALAEIKATQAA